MISQNDQHMGLRAQLIQAEIVNPGFRQGNRKKQAIYSMGSYVECLGVWNKSDTIMTSCRKDWDTQLEIQKLSFVLWKWHHKAVFGAALSIPKMIAVLHCRMNSNISINIRLRHDCEKPYQLFITPTTWNAESGTVEGKGNTGRMKWRRYLLNKEFSAYFSIQRDFIIIKITRAETIKMCHFIELGLKWDVSDNCCMFFLNDDLHTHVHEKHCNEDWYLLGGFGW